MDEYEKLEHQLKDLYVIYVQKYRNLAYMEQIQDDFDKAENDRTMVKPQSKFMQEKHSHVRRMIFRKRKFRSVKWRGKCGKKNGRNMKHRLSWVCFLRHW